MHFVVITKLDPFIYSVAPHCVSLTLCEYDYVYSLYFKSMEENPVKSPKDKLLLGLAGTLFKTSSDPDALMPYLIKDIPVLQVVEDQKITINADTAGQTTLYMSQ